MYGDATGGHWREMRVGKKLPHSGILHLALPLSGAVVAWLFFTFSKGEEEEKVKCAAAEFILQDEMGGFIVLGVFSHDRSDNLDFFRPSKQ